MMASACRCASEVQVADGAVQPVDAVVEMLRPDFRRPEGQAPGADDRRGLLADSERKQGWPLAEQGGDRQPRGSQRVLARYGWDAEAVRDALRAWVVAELADPRGVLVGDEPSFPKQGQQSVGGARQYCGPLGKLANGQGGGFLGDATARPRRAGPRAVRAGGVVRRPGSVPASRPPRAPHAAHEAAARPGAARARLGGRRARRLGHWR